MALTQNIVGNVEIDRAALTTIHEYLEQGLREAIASGDEAEEIRLRNAYRFIGQGLHESRCW